MRAAEPLVDRDAELEGLRAWVGAGVSWLKGPPGIGKSALARALASEAPDGVVVPLASVHDPEALVHAVASHLDVPAQVGIEPAVAIGRALAARRGTLLVLDDADGVLDHLGVADGWCARAPELRVLVTCRSAPPEREPVELGPLSDAGACELLVRRAQLRGVVLSPSAPDVVALAARFGGVPLALELAAGRLGVLSTGDALEQPAESLLRSADEGPHASLRAALDASWRHLEPALREALAQLSTFRTPFTLDAVRAVVAAEGATAEAALRGLADRSLVTATPDGRWHLLGPIREYAAVRLADPDVHRRHAAWFGAVGAAWRTGPSLEGERELERTLLDLEVALAHATRHADLPVAWGAAYGWLVGGRDRHPGRLEHPLRALAAAARDDERLRCRVEALLGEVLLHSGSAAEGVALLRRVAVAAAEHDVPTALDAYDLLATRFGVSSEEGRAAARAAVEVARGRPVESGIALATLAVLERRDHAWERAVPVAQEACRLLAGTWAKQPWAHANAVLADHAYATGRIAEGDLRYDLSLRVLTRSAQDDVLRGNHATQLANQGRLAEAIAEERGVVARVRERGRVELAAAFASTLASLLRFARLPDEAREVAGEALAEHRRTGNVRGEAYALGLLGMLATDRGDLALADELLAESAQAHDRAANPVGARQTEAAIATLRSRQGRHDEAVAIHRRALAEDPDPIHAIRLACAFAQAGEPVEAEVVLATVADAILPPRGTANLLAARGWIAYARGAFADAARAVEAAAGIATNGDLEALTHALRGR